MKKSVGMVLTLTFTLLPLIALGQAVQPPKIVYIDLQRVMLESERGKEAKKALMDEADKLKKTLDQKQDEIQKLKDALERQAATITPEARADKEKQYQAKLKDYQRLAGDYEADLRQKDAETSQKILNELQEIVKRLGDSEKYTLILEKTQAGILFSSAESDITGKVIALYNESAKKGGAPKK
ncbi:MAG TPA: OmpH family outer membrane protein [Syntrophorhabdales bacterium]|nr:OmpH family outer membrane protein [Syntrophorhabdales bacterium]